MPTSIHLRTELRRLARTPTLSARPRTVATSAISAQNIYDVVIVGGGPAGLSLASGLRSSSVTNHLRVALVEGFPLNPWTATPGTYSNRVSSLTPGSVSFLETIGAWQQVNKDRVQMYNGMKVWDGISNSKITFSSDLLHTSSAIAFMCENLNLTTGLLTRIRELGGVELMDKTRVKAVKYGKDEGEDGLDLSTWPVVETDGGRRLAARLLVGADGANSPVRTFANIETRGWDYGRHGVVATLKLAEDPSIMGDRIAYQRFLPTGPVALLPLPGPFASMVWSTTPKHAAALKAMTPGEFAAIANAAFRLSHVDLEYILDLPGPQVVEEVKWREEVTVVDPKLVPERVEVIQEGSVASFPLKMRHADTYISERVALIGDAAHSVHPLAGQGLNQGIGDVQSLVKAVEYAVQHGQDIGAKLALEPYVSEQYGKNHVLLGVVDKLHKLYGTTSAPVVAIRSLGLDAVNALDTVKSFIMNRAAGR